MTLPELIAKLEAANEGSDALDREIAKVCGIEWSSDEDGNYGPYDITPSRIHFTRNLECARSIIPRPRGSMSLASTFSVGGFADNRPHGAWATVWYDPTMAGAPHAPAYLAKAASPALALCIASLKARL